MCRRSFGNINEAKQISLEEALRSKEIHAAFISTENRSHEETIRYFEVFFYCLFGWVFSLFSPFALQCGSMEELYEAAAGEAGRPDS